MFSMQNKVIKTGAVIFLAMMGISQAAYANSDIRWMNKWDPQCYQQESNVNTCRQDWYQTTQGSHLIMWEVFQTIEEANSTRLFRDRNSLANYGFLFPEANDFNQSAENYGGYYGERVEQNLNQDGLPFGFLRDKSNLDNRNYLGLTCAACHTGRVDYAGNTYYVEGGQGNADVERFLIELGDALVANKNDDSKRRRFTRRFRSYAWNNKDWSARPINIFRGERYLDEAIEYVRGFTNRNQGMIENGPGRLDAIGSILNQLHVAYAGKPESEAKPLTAPVSFPYIWGVSELECVQTNCISNNPLNRNIGEVLGVFGYINIDEDENVDNLLELAFRELSPLFDYTPKVDNLFKLEKSLSYASAPKWPDSFPPLNSSLVAAGKPIYDQHCGSCHVDNTDGVTGAELTEPNSIGRRYTKVARIPYEEVGTDPAFAMDYGLRLAKTGILGNVLAIAAPESVDPATGLPFGEAIPEDLNALVLLGVSTNVITDDHFGSLGFRHTAERADRSLPANEAVEKLKVEYSNGQVDRNRLTPTAYKAKPLNGIAFTGPFLHNGSVRTLADLLKRPEDRPDSFRFGTTEYDVYGVGYADAGSYILDTSIRGNSNSGHDYGTSLSASDKSALLEYLKAMD